MYTYFNPVAYLANVLGLSYTVTSILVVAVVVWTIAWKGFGLWRAARNKQFWWFFFMLIINDLGILEILYLLWFRSDKKAVGSSAA